MPGTKLVGHGAQPPVEKRTCRDGECEKIFRSIIARQRHETEEHRLQPERRETTQDEILALALIAKTTEPYTTLKGPSIEHIQNTLGISRNAVDVRLCRLRKKGLVTYDKSLGVRLTAKGEASLGE